jgi:UDP:flavonoid glycosyltransferase YjiC (YdhE family)
MRVGIQGWGSEGDLRPLVALGSRLRRAGHDVRLVLSPVDEVDWASLCQREGLEASIVPERSQMKSTLEEICRASQSPDISKVSRKLLELAYFPFQEQMYQAGLALCAQSDLVVGLFSSTYVKAACLKSGTPFVSVHYYPGLIRSREWPPAGFPAWRWLNPIAWKLLGMLIDLAFKKPTAQFFASKGLPKVRHHLDVTMSDRLNLIACSPTLYARPPDWGEKLALCGDFVMSQDERPWEPSPALQEFLGAGEKPILVSLGTMEHLAPERARKLVADAVRQAKVRAILQSKCRLEEGRDGDLFFLRWAPHRRLLPLCSAMVLHGGAGTTHAALRAGLPAVVLPFIFEQGLWGGLLHRAGSAPKPLSFWKATPDALASRIQQASTEPMRSRARELASAVAREDGTGVAVALLEKMSN